LTKGVARAVKKTKPDRVREYRLSLSAQELRSPLIGFIAYRKAKAQGMPRWWRIKLFFETYRMRRENEL